MLNTMTQFLKGASRAARWMRFVCCLILMAGWGGCDVSAQEFVVAPFNFRVENGYYTVQSTNAERLAMTKQEIVPQAFAPRPDPNLFLLFPKPGGILLFKSKNLKDPANVAGKLTDPSLAVVDTVFHNQVYLQKNGNDQHYSFDLCYSLRIDGQRYYTDFRPHDFTAFRYPLVYHKQLFVLASQDTGYEVYADKGYPEHFHIVVFDMQNGGIRLRFASNELPFRYGYEFLDASDNAIKSDFHAAHQTFRIEIKGLNDTYRGVWDGRKLEHLD